MQDSLPIQDLLKYVPAISSVVAMTAILVGLRQLATVRRSHLFTVFKDAMELLDSGPIRDARHWVYDRSPQEIATLTGADIDPKTRSDDQKKNTALVEPLIRSIDRMGFMVRNGRIPIELIAQFYAFPILKSWYHLHVYIQKERERRQQFGHMWEFENLAMNIVAGSAAAGKGVWRDVKEHEDISTLLKDIPPSSPSAIERRRTRPSHPWRASHLLGGRS